MKNCLRYFDIRPLEGYPNGADHLLPNIYEQWRCVITADVDFRCCKANNSVDALPLYYELMLLDRWMVRGRGNEKDFEIGEGVFFHIAKEEPHIRYTFYFGDNALSEPSLDTPENIAGAASDLREKLKVELSKYFDLSDVLSFMSLSEYVKTERYLSADPSDFGL